MFSWNKAKGSTSNMLKHIKEHHNVGQPRPENDELADKLYQQIPVVAHNLSHCSTYCTIVNY